jgi:hypothetical protein
MIGWYGAKALGMREAGIILEPRELRRGVTLEIVATRSNGEQYRVVVADISRDGCQLRTDAPFAVGEKITLTDKLLGDRTGEVRWTCAGRVGMMFVS